MANPYVPPSMTPAERETMVDEILSALRARLLDADSFECNAAQPPRVEPAPVGAYRPQCEPGDWTTYTFRIFKFRPRTL